MESGLPVLLAAALGFAAGAAAAVPVVLFWVGRNWNAVADRLNERVRAAEEGTDE